MRHLWANKSGKRNCGKMQMNREDLFRMEFSDAINYHQPTKKEKRFRIAFTTDQVNFLEREFKKSPYIGSAQRKEVANFLNLPERAVKIWFQNRRMKEKKDVNKDPDDDQINRRNDNANDPLSNVIVFPSVNERSLYTLQQLPTSPPSNANRTNINHENINLEASGSSFSEPLLLNYYSDISPEKDNTKTPKITYKSSSPVVNHTPNDYKSSAEYSIDLCKKYKSGKNIFDNNKKQLSGPSQGIAANHELVKMENQNLPEDLSLNRLTKPSEPSSASSMSPKSSGYIPVYVNYPQPYLSAGNMLWKPVNVLPIMSKDVPPVDISNQPGTLSMAQEEAKSKKKCNCDCHMETIPAPVVLPENNANPQAQYVLTAVPFQNYPPL